MLVATTFLMVGPKMLTERDKEKMRLDIADEQLDTISRVTMGLTLGAPVAMTTNLIRYQP